MDTISIKIYFEKNGGFYIENLKAGINRIKSPYGYTYCDFTSIADNYLLIKVSYPRYFRGINAYLVKNSMEVLEVNKNLVANLEAVLVTQSLKMTLNQVIHSMGTILNKNTSQYISPPTFSIDDSFMLNEKLKRFEIELKQIEELEIPYLNKRDIGIIGDKLLMVNFSDYLK